MADKKPWELAPVELSFWMNGAELQKLGRAAQAFFKMLGRTAFWAAEERDPLTCDSTMLDLLAWERGIRRYHGEPERLYRLRVRYAYVNGRDAGSINGWQAIFKRLELPPVELEERVQGQDWDIIGIIMDDSAFPAMQDVLELIINEYGRTCRRYRFVSRITQPVYIHTSTFDDDHTTVCAVEQDRTAVTAYTHGTTFDHDTTLECAFF